MSGGGLLALACVIAFLVGAASYFAAMVVAIRIMAITARRRAGTRHPVE
ncbi:MAG: hypothetical protein KUL88_04445 [Rhizobium sp.]|nr:hypothetical protein [Rhizobium sp.]